jgi:transcriptional regulator with XRE-family HTH domain
LEELKRIREKKGWSQTRLAQESGVDRATINQVEGGRRSPTIATLEVLAATMGAEVADFFPKAQAPLPLEIDGGRGLQLWSELAEDLAARLTALIEAPANKDRQLGRHEGAYSAAAGVATTIEVLVNFIDAEEIPVVWEEKRALLRAWFKLASAADRLEELTIPEVRTPVRITDIQHQKYKRLQAEAQEKVEGMGLTAEQQQEVMTA